MRRGIEFVEKRIDKLLLENSSIHFPHRDRCNNMILFGEGDCRCYRYFLHSLGNKSAQLSRTKCSTLAREEKKNSFIHCQLSRSTMTNCHMENSMNTSLLSGKCILVYTV